VGHLWGRLPKSQETLPERFTANKVFVSREGIIALLADHALASAAALSLARLICLLELRPCGLAEYPPDGITGTKTSGCGGGGIKR